MAVNATDLLSDDTGEEWSGDEAAVERLNAEPRAARPAPFALGEPYFVVPATITNIIIGRSIANVKTTITVALHVPYDGFSELMGEHALAAMFDGSFVGNGISIADATLHADVENAVLQKLKLLMPRYDDGRDQLHTYIAPFLDDPAIIDRLLSYSGSWRLNLPVGIDGDLALYEPQARFDLTRRADDD
jgi:hypothetical protein